MPYFQYTARDRTGNTLSGTVEADTNSLAAARLREQGLWVTDLRQSAGARERNGAAYGASVPSGPSARVDRSFSRRLRSPVSLKDLSLFYRQLHTMLNAGMPFYQSLEMLSQSAQTPSPALRVIVADMARQVLAGGRFSEVMARYPWLFDRMQVRMVEAGEAGGLLVAIFKRLAEYLEREYEIRMDVSRKTLYPKLVVLLLLFVLPINIPLTVAGYLHDLGSLILLALLATVPVWFAARVFLTSTAGRNMWDQVKLSIPVIGPLIRKMTAARFARSFAALYGAGVPISAALGMAGEACGNHLLEQRSLIMVPALERGVSLSQTLGASGFFPPMFIGMVATGESTGNLDQMLEKAADFYEEESRHASTQLVVILGVVLLIVVAIFVAIKMIGFYTGLFNGIMHAGGAGD